MSARPRLDRVDVLPSESLAPHVLGLTALLFLLLPFQWHLDTGLGTVNLSYGDAVVGAVGALWLAGTLAGRRLPKYALAVGAFVLVAATSLAASLLTRPAYLAPGTGAVELVKFLGAVAWMVAAFALARGRARRLVPVAAAVSVAVAVAFAGWTVVAAVLWDVVRPSGPFENPNLFGNYLVFNACMAGLVAVTWPGDRSNRVRVASLAALPVLLLALATTESRGSMLALAGATATVLLAFRGRVERATLLRGIAAVGATVVALLSVLALYGAAFLSHMAGRLSKNVGIRLELWAGGLEAFRSAPLLGIGYGQAASYLEFHAGLSAFPHNVYVTVAAETGLVGLVAFLLSFAWVLRDGWRDAGRAAALAFLVAFLVGTAVQGGVTDVDKFRTLWIAVGFVAAYDADLHGTDVAPRELFQAGRERLRAAASR